MPWPGDAIARDRRRVAERCPRRLARGGRRLPRKPREDDVGRAAEDLRAGDRQRDAGDRERDHDDDQRALGREPAEQAPRRRRRTCFAFCGGPIHAPTGRASAGRRRRGRGGRGTVASLMRPPPAPRSARSRSRRTSGTSRQLGVRAVADDACRRRARGSGRASTDARDALRDEDHRRVRACAARARRAAGPRSRDRARRTSRRTGTRAGSRSSARAIASRWRWPPETFVPPCAIGASSFCGIASTKSLRLRELERGPQLVVGRVGVAEPQVRRDRAARTDTRAAAPRRSAPTAPRARARGRRRRRRAPRPRSDRRAAGSARAAWSCPRRSSR